MGEMADFALDAAFDDLEHYDEYKNAPLHIQYEEGIIDEYGYEIGRANSGPYKNKIKDKTKCPICGSALHKVSGKFGEFLGCNNFPNCKGSVSL